MSICIESLTLDELKAMGEANDWLTHAGYETLRNGYLLPGETPRRMYRRVADSVAYYLSKPEMADKFYKYIDNNWLCLATPVACNSGTKRGLPISCYGSYVADDLHAIFQTFVETAMLTKHGGGTSTTWTGLRDRGARIGQNGISDGIIPWLKVKEATLQSTAQGGVRRGSGAQYFSIDCSEADELIDLRRATGDISRRCLSTNFHHGAVVSDDFMSRVKSGNQRARDLWIRLLSTRLETGEPYIMFKDTANRNASQGIKKHGLTIEGSNLCTEIFLPSDEDHTFVCCLSSLNVARWDEWKDTDVVETAIWFLDGVMSEFIAKADGLPGFEKAVRFARKSRALGLGVLGWHSLLQSRMIPFESFDAMTLNNEIFKTINERSQMASRALADEYGEVDWTAGCSVRNLTTMAVAPTTSNSLISGGVSQGIEPLVANIYAHKTAKGTFVRKNPYLETLLASKRKDTPEVWDQINQDAGSVRGLSFLEPEEKSVFATAREINQFAIIRQAAQRQRWIDQGQSVNLFFAASDKLDTDSRKKLGKYIHDVHMEAWELGLKGLYYVRPTSVINGDAVYRTSEECTTCES